MTIPNLHDYSLLGVQVRALAAKMGEPFNKLPVQSAVAALAKHGGMYSLLDHDLMTARMAALGPTEAMNGHGSNADIAAKLSETATNFFYRLVEKKGYRVASELISFITEPGRGNGVTYDEGAEPSPDIPAVFTFVGQFIDHDLTFNGMNLTADERGVTVQDDASPVIDLDHVYGPRKQAPTFGDVFDRKGRFNLREFPLGNGKNGVDLPRTQDGIPIILDPRNDENQLILQIHLLLQRYHNKLIDSGALDSELKGDDRRWRDSGSSARRSRRHLAEFRAKRVYAGDTRRSHPKSCDRADSHPSIGHKSSRGSIRPPEA